MSVDFLKTTSLFQPVIKHEEAFSGAKFFGVALTASAIALAILPYCPIGAVALVALAGWSLWSATIVVLNRVSQWGVIKRLHAFAMEFNSAVICAAVFPWTLLSHHHRPGTNLSGRPILMINGYLSFGSTWYYQRKRLEDAGFGPIYTMNVGSGRSIKTYARYVADKVKEIQKETGKNDIILIGHSKGGLVSSYYATHLVDKKTKVTDVITIGSPLSGTPLARVGFGKDACQMRSGAKFHCKLREKMKNHPTIRFSHIGSKVDNVVPLASSLLDSPRQMIIDDMGHLGLVFSSRVADQICQWLF